MQELCKFSSSHLTMNLSPLGEPSSPIEKQKANGAFIEQKPSVLVFAADRDLFLLLKTALELWSYEVLEAKTYEQALLVAENKMPNLVLMDLERIFYNSLSEMKEMQNCTFLQKIPFILLSGHAQNDVREMALNAGAMEFLVKPINLELLENSIKLHLKKDFLTAKI